MSHRFGPKQSRRASGLPTSRDHTITTARDLEEASHGINYINQRRKRDRAKDSAAERVKIERGKITLSPVLDEWLKK